MKFKIYKFKKISSTNDYAINFIKNKNIKYGYIHADLQTKGRGTYGRKWISDEGNLFGSIFFPLKSNYPPFNEFSIINSVIIFDIIKSLCSKQNISFKLPNDVFVNGRKICGILQELITLNQKQFLIIGMGVNIISNPDINVSYQATNILSETKTKPKIIEIINLIISSYEKFFGNLHSYNYINFKKKADLITLN